MNTPGKISLWGIRSHGWATVHGMAHGMVYNSPRCAAEWRVGDAERAKTGLLWLICAKFAKGP